MQTSRFLRPIRESLLNNPRKTRILSCLSPLSEDFDVKVTEDHQGFQFSCFKGGARRREKEIKREFERRGDGGGGEIVTHPSKVLRDFLSLNCLKGAGSVGLNSFRSYHRFLFRHDYCSNAAAVKRKEIDDPSQRAVTTALCANFLVFSLKFAVWLSTSSHVMLAEVIHSVADFANQALLAYGLSSSRRGPDALHPYGYSKERFVWSLISAVGIFCLGSGATIVHGFQNLWTAEAPSNIKYAALVIGGSFIIEGASLVVAIHAVRKGAAAEGMKVRDYVWRGHDPTSVAVMTEYFMIGATGIASFVGLLGPSVVTSMIDDLQQSDGAAVTGLLIAGASLVAVNKTGNAIYDPIGSIVVGHLLGMVAIFLIQRNRHALIGRAIDDNDMERVLHFLKNDPVVDALYDCKSEVIGPGFFRFKAEIDFNGVVVVQNYLQRTGRDEWAKQFREAGNEKDDSMLLNIMSNYGEEVVTALGSEVDRLEKEIQKLVPGIRHVDIEAHNPEKEIQKLAPVIRHVDMEAHNPKGPTP